MFCKVCPRVYRDIAPPSPIEIDAAKLFFLFLQRMRSKFEFIYLFTKGFMTSLGKGGDTQTVVEHFLNLFSAKKGIEKLLYHTGYVI